MAGEMALQLAQLRRANLLNRANCGASTSSGWASSRYHRRMLYAGIDEAGYGPLLGPLCGGVSVFELDGSLDDDTPCLWHRLRTVLTRSRRDSRGRISIDDSKKLKGAGEKAHPLTHLERGVLAFASLMRDRSWLEKLDDTALFTELGVDAPASPWYGTTTPLPVGRTLDALRIDRSRLNRTLDRTETACVHFAARAIDADDFNVRVERSGSKAVVNWELIVSLAETCWARAGNRQLLLIIDRQGGRSHYLNELHAAWPAADRQVLMESEAESRYRLTMPQRGPIEIRFAAQADANHLPVALASMAAKYVRELLMIRLNRFFQSHMPELKPTAGYVEDGRRFVSEIEPIIASARIERSALIRSC
jgi:hypothetical protein